MRTTAVGLFLAVTGCSSAEAAPPAALPAALADPAAGGTQLGCFAPVRVTEVADPTAAIESVDLDRDGDTDLVVDTNHLDEHGFTVTMATYRNDGTGRLERIETHPAGHLSYSIATGDIDGDGSVDVAVNSVDPRRVLVYSGSGDGRLQPKPDVATRHKPMAIELADIDGDRRLDIIAISQEQMEVMRGDGKFKFSAGKPLALAPAADRPSIADFDGDGRLDVALVSNDASKFLMVSSKRRGSPLRVASSQPACSGPSFLQQADFDGDGRLDVAYTCDDQVEVRQNRGKGVFTATSVAASHVERVAVGDFSGNGTIDLVTMGRERPGAGSDMAFYEGDGRGQFTERASGRADVEVSHPIAADMNGDGRTDLVTSRWNGAGKAEIALWIARACEQ